MKKLMTMLASVGMAFGLFADPITPIGSTSFEAADNEFNGDNLIVNQDGSKWTCADDDAKLTKGKYVGDAYNYAGKDMTRYSTFDDQANYLNVKTAFNKPLVRTEGATVGDDAVFFDQLVKFTAADTDTDFAIGSDAKIAFYVVDKSEADAPEAETNLYVVSGKYVNDQLSVVTNDFGYIDVNEWHRLTIKTIKGYAGEKAAFEVFVDGVALRMSEPAFDVASEASLTADAKVINKARKLFPALGGTLALSGLALAGTGAIDDVMATTELPGEWAEDKVVNLAWDDHVTGFTYTIDNVPTTVDTSAAESPIQIAFPGEFQVTISGVGCEENWGFKTVECKNGCTYNEQTGVITFAGENQTATITTKDTTPRIKIGANTYATFAEAIKAIGTLTEGQTVTVELQDDVPASWDEEEGTEATFDAGEGEIIIDLAGNTISGTAEEGAYVVKCIGNVTIMDSVGHGAIAVSENYTGAVRESSGCLKVTGGRIDGAVKVDENADAEISGGSFASEEDEAFYLDDFLADGFEAEYAEGYWTVKAIPTFTVTFKVDGETYAIVDKVVDKVGDKMPEDPEKVGYTFTGWTANELPFTADTIVTADTEVTAQFDVITYKVLYLDMNDETYTNDTATSFTVANYSDLTALWDGVREGLVFDEETGWLDSEMTDPMDLGAVKAAIAAMIQEESVSDVVLYGQWEEVSQDVTITLPDVQDVPGVTAITAYQSADDGDTWTVVEDGKIAVGNLWKVEATADEGYLVQNPINSGTAEKGVDIKITTDDFEGKVAQAVVSVAVKGVTAYYVTAEEALGAVQAAEAAEQFPIVVTALTDAGLTIADAGRTAKIAKDVAITITQPKFWSVSGVLGYAGVIDGTVNANDIEKIDNADITLGLGAYVSVLPTSTIDASFFTSGEEGYEVQLTDTQGGFNSFSLVKVWTVTVTLAEGITAVATNVTQGGEAKVLSETGSFKVNDNDVIGIEYACSVDGYKPSSEGEAQVITDDTEFTVTKQAINYTITYKYKDAELTELTPKAYTVEAAETLPTEVELLDGASFEAWYDNAELDGDPVTEIAQGSTGNKTFYAKASKVVDPVAEIIEDKVEGFDQLEAEQQKAAYDNVQALYGQFESTALAEVWIEIVYGSASAKIPAEKLAATTEELVSISVKYDLPILTEAVEAQVVAATADGFNFKLVDGEDVNVAMAEVEEMIEFSADLSTFAVNKTEVGAEVDEDGVTIKATFLKPADEAKGFMKLHLSADK